MVLAMAAVMAELEELLGLLVKVAVGLAATRELVALEVMLALLEVLVLAVVVAVVVGLVLYYLFVANQHTGRLVVMEGV